MTGLARKVGVVLAAGFGSRLASEEGESQPKPLIRVGGTPLILRAVRGLEIAGCDEVVVVLGFGAPGIRAGLEDEYGGGVPLHFVINERFDLQNGVSVLAAAPRIDNLFVLVMADHLVSDDVMQRAGAHTPVDDGATLLVDYRVDSIFDMDDATKVLEVEGRITSIGKTIAEFNCVDTGVFVCTVGLLNALQHQFDLQGDASLSDGVQKLAASGLMRVLDIEDGFWQDVDTPEMLAFAQKSIAELSRRS
ncbi:MAG: 1L-myo-inositol 1-phosphate cytidylyltransferase [Rhodothermales bacterium]